MNHHSHHIAGSASDSLALIMIANQFDPLFKDLIAQFFMRAKLKYEPLSALMAKSQEEVQLWLKIRDIEDEISNDGSISAMDRYTITNQRTSKLHEEYRELQAECRNLQRMIQEQVQEETREPE